MARSRTITLTEEQDSLARDLVASGRFADVDAVIAEGLQRLQVEREAETLDRRVLERLLRARRDGAFLDGDAFDARIDAMICRFRDERDLPA